MDLDKKILSDITVFMKYAKYIPELQRRENWEELVTRNMNMHIKKFPNLKEEITEVYDRSVYPKKVLPAMRSLQFAGIPMEVNNCRMFNCSYQPIDHYKAFSEGMFLLLSGCGYGYSVQKHHIDKLPEINKPVKGKRYIIGDSIHGWSDAIKVLIDSYFTGKAKPLFDYSDIRQKGSRLITSGGKAPGPEPLKRCLFEIEQILENKNNGEKLTSIDCHSIMCHIADSVLSGGIRRSAMICLFTMDDEDMLSCKSGNWWELNPHFARANNSAVVVTSRITNEEFNTLWERIQNSGAGEPGIYFTNDPEYGTNPLTLQAA
jgi:ribonucleoside-diphosphate reductase alpha chain